MEYLNSASLYMPFLTALGSISLFPNPPAIFKDLAKNELVKWLFVLILIVQGGGDGNWRLGMVMTAVLYVLVKVLDMIYPGQKETYHSYRYY